MRPLATTPLIALLLLLVSASAQAHPLAPALLQLTQSTGNSYDVLWRLSAIQPAQALPHPQLPAHCRQTTTAQASLQNTAVTQRWTIDCGDQGLTAATIGIDGLSSTGVNVILRIEDSEAGSMQALLDARSSQFVVPAPETALPVLQRYLQLGMQHLALGPDHLLFLLGLLLLVQGLRRLIITLTAFTLGHSLTLSLAALGLLHINQALMELGIAISLLVLARELLRKQPSALGRHPALMAVGFGLLHGLGFAGALGEIGLPQTEVVSALLGFNLGIELAQLLIAVSVIPLTVGLRKMRYNNHAARWAGAITAVPAYLIGSLAILWCIERIETLQGNWHLLV